MNSHQSFEELLYEAVDEGLSTLGDAAKQAIYYYLENGAHINRQEIPHKVEDFTVAIWKIFGLGSNFLLILILKQLYEKIGESFDLPISNELDFIKSVEQARKIELHGSKQLEAKI